MTGSMAVLGILVAAFLVVSAFEWIGMELAALALVVALALTGILAPDEAIAGFSNEVVIAIAGLFVINAAVAKSGVLAWLGSRLADIADRSPRGALAILLTAAGAASMLVSNIATVALLAPAVVAVCDRSGISPSKFLLPLAYVSLVGGMATLIGATGNLIVQGMAIEAGARGFSFFEFAWVGLPILALTLVYLLTIGWRTVPERRPAREDAAGALRDFLVEVALPEDSDLVGKSLADARLPERFGLTLVSIRRGDRRLVAPGPADTLAAADRLIVQGGAEQLAAASASNALETLHDAEIERADLESADIDLYEVLVPPRSPLIGRSAQSLQLRQRWSTTLLAILRGASRMPSRPERVRIRAGDELLLQGPRRSIADMEEEEQVILLSEFQRRELSPRRLALSLGVLVGVVALTATGWTSLAIAVLLGVTVLLLGRQLTVEEAFLAIDLKLVVVVASVLPLGHAFEAAGAVEPTARMLGSLHALAGPWAVLGALFIATSALVQVVQKAAIALAVPLALAASQATASDPAPFLMAVAIAGSCAFLTPLAHPVNLLVHAPGHYRFGDFLRVGLPLQILVTAVAIVLIPIIWPFGA